MFIIQFLINIRKGHFRYYIWPRSGPLNQSESAFLVVQNWILKPSQKSQIPMIKIQIIGLMNLTFIGKISAVNSTRFSTLLKPRRYRFFIIIWVARKNMVWVWTAQSATHYDSWKITLQIKISCKVISKYYSKRICNIRMFWHFLMFLIFLDFWLCQILECSDYYFCGQLDDFWRKLIISSKYRWAHIKLHFEIFQISKFWVLQKPSLRSQE